MARKTAKKAAKKTTRKTAKKAPRGFSAVQPNVKVKIPAGFAQPETGFYDSHDFEKEPEITGTVVDFRTIPPKKKKDNEQRLMIVERSDNGVKESVWHSHQLSGIFDACEIGDEVYICYTGVKKLDKGKTLKTFETAYKSNAIKPAKKKARSRR